jgi:O-antigen/teichoic acid export membrane protein
LAILCVFVSTLYGHAVVAIQKQKTMTLGYALTAIIAVVGYFLFIPKFGVWGAAGVTCLSEFLIALLTFSVVSMVSRTLPNLAIAARAVLAGLFMYLILSLLPTWPTVVVILIGATVYGITMLLIGGIKITEIKNLVAKT